MRSRSFAAATDDMARPSVPPDGAALQRRFVSALVILPLAGGAIWFGSWIFALLLAVIGAAMCWELTQISGVDDLVAQSAMIVAALATPFVQLAFGFDGVFAAVGIGAVVLAPKLFALGMPGVWIVLLGFAYVVIGVNAAGWIRADGDVGLATVFWLVGVVIATDVGAYFTGRSIGGPKLAPDISPNKTWSGLGGGMVCAAVVGLLVAVSGMGASPAATVIASLLLSAISQIGDLIESKLKRYFNVKDASHLIPGHGGFLDRFDGYLTVMPAAALMSAAGGGSPISWQ